MNDPRPAKPMTVTWAEARRSAAEAARWNAELPKFDPPHVPPAKPKPPRSPDR